MALSTGNLLNFKFISATEWAKRGENASLKADELASSDIIFIEATKQIYAGGIYVGVSPEQATQLSNLLNDVNSLKDKVGSNEQISKALFQIVQELKGKLDGGSFEGAGSGATINNINGAQATNAVDAINKLNTFIAGVQSQLNNTHAGVSKVNDVAPDANGNVQITGAQVSTTAAAGDTFKEKTIDQAFAGVQSNIDGIQARIGAEETERQNSVTGIQARIDAEETLRGQQISGVQTQLSEKIGNLGGTQTTVTAYVDQEAAKALAGAQATAKAYVDGLAGTDWTTAAQTVQDIITELSEGGNADFTTVVDKVRGDFSYEGAPEGQQSIKGYIDHAVSVGTQGAQSAAGTAETNAKAYVDGKINDLDATERGNLTDGDAVSTGHKVGVKVVETDGKITQVLVVENDIASAQALQSTTDQVTGAQGRITNVENQLKWTVV